MNIEKNGSIIALATQKGGAGKTTIALNAANALQSKGYAVCVVDTDRQGSAENWRIRANDNNVSDVPEVEVNPSELVGDTLKRLKKQFDFIVVDTASNLGNKGESTRKSLSNVLRQADIVIIPIIPSPLDIDASVDFVELLEVIQDDRDGLPLARLLVNQAKNSILSTHIQAILAQTHEDIPIFKTAIPSREAFKKTLAVGQTVIKPKLVEGAGDAINDLVDEIIELVGGVKK